MIDRRITITDSSMSYTELDKINSLEAKKSKMFFDINLLLTIKYINLATYWKNSMKKDNNYYISVCITDINFLSFSNHQKSNYFTTIFNQPGEKEPSFREDIFWDEYDWIKEEYKKKNWDVKVHGSSSNQELSIYLHFHVIPVKDIKSVSKYELMDI